MQSALLRYAELTWNPDDIVEIRPLKPHQGERVWTYARDLGDHIPRMITENERGANMYAGILPRNTFGRYDGRRWIGGRAEDVDGGRVLWLDMDNVEAERAVELSGRVGLPGPTMTVATGHGAHLYWKLRDWLPRDEISRVLAGLVAFLKADPALAEYVDASAKDPVRILRLPGFINHKPPAALARIVSADPDRLHDLDDFKPFLLEAAPASGTAGTPNSPRPAPSGDLALERARRYLAMVDGSGRGGRTNTAFRAACVVVNDIGGVSDQDAVLLLTAWDSAVNTPSISADYGPDEIAKIVGNARRYAKKPAGCLNAIGPNGPGTDGGDQDVDLSGILNSRTDASHPNAAGATGPGTDGGDQDVDLSGILNSRTDASHPNAAGATGPGTDGVDQDVDLSGILSTRARAEHAAMPRRYLDMPGLPGEVIRFNLDTAPKPQPVLALAGALALQALLCSRKLTDEYGTRPNMYICSVAPAGAGKDHARQLNKRILNETGLTDIHAETVKSGPALTTSLLLNPAMLFQIDEIGRFIQAAKNPERGSLVYEVITRFLELYSSSGGMYAIPRINEDLKDARKARMRGDRSGDLGRAIIRQPHLILYGTTVPESLYSGLTAESVSDGFLARLLIFDVNGHNPKRRLMNPNPPVPEAILAAVRWWRDYEPPGAGNLDVQPYVAPVTDAARKIAHDFIDLEYDQQKALRDSPLAALWGRTGQNADKLALLYAAARRPHAPVVDDAAAAWGYGLAEWLTRSMVDTVKGNVAESPFHAVVLKVKAILASAGGRMDHSRLLKRLKGVKARELAEIITTMEEMGDIVKHHFPTATKTGVEYRLVE
ncbi:MAG: RepB family DNA primase [Planctomycetaceae bacterium]|nr:RepB family DNA primase [Planctomycetaceae bacterium]